MHTAGGKRDPAGPRIGKIVDRAPARRAAKTGNMGPDLQVCARREGFEPPTARSVARCSASIWSAPDGSGLLTLDASSVQTAPDGSRRIVWMIKRMIKPRRRGAPPTPKPERPRWSKHQIFRLATRDKGHADYHQHESASLGLRDGVQDELARGDLEDR
jgi:hypothetical protein